jgi:SAM-dependent methyltransferase
MIDAALGDAQSVVNVGAGTGSYEPKDRAVIAVEPSDVMITQRSADAARCLQGVAEAVPLAEASVDAAMTVLSMHHWTDLTLGLAEMARVARRRVVALTWIPDGPPFWLTEDYFPEFMEYDRAVFPSSANLLALMAQTLGPARIAPVPIPHDCIDGFMSAYWRRPEAYLNADVRRAISSFALVDVAAGIERLRDDLASGRWEARNSHLRSQDTADFGYRLIVCEK